MKRTIITAALILLAMAGALSASVAAQGAKKPWTVSWTPDGQPDLQGFWSNATFTPMQRPAGITKEFYTEEEAAEVLARATSSAGAPAVPENTPASTGGGRSASPVTSGGVAADTNVTLGEWVRNGATPVPGTVPDVHYDFSQFGLTQGQAARAKNLRTSLVVDPPNGRIPPMIPEARERNTTRAEAQKALGAVWDSAKTQELDNRCIVNASVVPMLPGGYTVHYQIVQAQGHVMILAEHSHDARVIPLDGRPHLSAGMRQWWGSSRGHWEGDTLVVETRNFNGRNPFYGASEDLRVTERFTRVSADQIRYRFTVEDEHTWERPWSAEVPLQKTIGPMFEAACHEGNYSMLGVLSAARAEEKRQTDAVREGRK